MENAYKGDVEIAIDGKRLTLCFDWSALGAIKTELGVDTVAAVLSQQDLVGLSKLTAIGLRVHHPDWTPEQIFKLHPPVLPLAKKLDRALFLAWNGPEEPEPENPLMRMASLLMPWRRQSA